MYALWIQQASDIWELGEFLPYQVQHLFEASIAISLEAKFSANLVGFYGSIHEANRRSNVVQNDSPEINRFAKISKLSKPLFNGLGSYPIRPEQSFTASTIEKY